MKSNTNIIATVILFFTSLVLTAQDISTPGGYMDNIGKDHREIAKDVLSYTSAVAHGKSARKVENRRQSMIQTIRNSIKRTSGIPPFKGDKSLKDSTLNYLNTSLIVLNNEYEKILNMEDIAEQSYDAMEAYLLAQDKAYEHLQFAEDRFNNTYKEFAKKNNVTILENNNDELKIKLQTTAAVNKYHRMVYLVFFKSNKQEVYLMEAIDKKDIGAIEQNKNTLAKFTEEGLNKLDTMKAFKQDKNLVLAAKKALEFYKMECTTKIEILTKFFVKQDAFDKMNKSFSTKSPNDRTQEEVDEYNKFINEFNASVINFNNVTKSLNEERNKVLNNWTKTSQTFLDKYVP